MNFSSFLSSANVLAGLPWHARTPPALQALSLSFTVGVFLLRGSSNQNCGQRCQSTALFSDPMKWTRFNLHRDSYLSWNKLQTGIMMEETSRPVKRIAVFTFIEKMTSSGRMQVRIMSDLYLAHLSSFGQILSECYFATQMLAWITAKNLIRKESELEHITLQRYRAFGVIRARVSKTF